jgi:DNA helicase II / ATP-dependent DNA helicase PcrA
VWAPSGISLKLELCGKRKEILTTTGHLLVTGGPGSGKTTIALLKAQTMIPGLRPEQQVLFLSFSRAAIRQVLLRCKSILSAVERQRIEVQTYHSFCLDVLKTHGRLLTGKAPKIIYPDVERVASADFDGDWEQERARRAKEDAMFVFDGFAAAAAEVFSGCEAVCKLVANKYRLIIVDEFQDTDDDQWRMVAALSKYATIFCLADPDQSIFQYQPKVDPARLGKAKAFLKPKVFDLAGDNHRSPNSGILAYADAVLKNQQAPAKSPGVSFLNYPPRMFAPTVHLAVLAMFSQLRKDGIADPTVAVLCRGNTMVATISSVLSESHEYKERQLPPKDHIVLWDAELSLAAAAVLASVLEWKGEEPKAALVRTLRFTAAFYKLKYAAGRTQSAEKLSRQFQEAAVAAGQGGKLRINAAKELKKLVDAGVEYVGDPVADWKSAQRVLAKVAAYDEISREVKLVRLFRATDLLGKGLAELWLQGANYRSAAVLVKRVLDQERLIFRTRSGGMSAYEHSQI